MHGAGAGLGAGLLGVDVHPADRVGHRLEPVETDDGHMVERNVDQLLQRADEQLRTAVRVGGVDLVLAMPGHVDVHVAGEVHEVDLLAVTADVHQDDDVGTSVGHAAAAVRADQQDVLGVLGRWVLGGRGLARARCRQQSLVLDVGRDRVVQERQVCRTGPDREQQHERDHTHDDPTGAVLLGGGVARGP